MLGLSQFHGWVGQDLSRAMQSIETVEKSERERESSSKIRRKSVLIGESFVLSKGGWQGGRKVWGKQGTCFLWELSGMTSALWGIIRSSAVRGVA